MVKKKEKGGPSRLTTEYAILGQRIHSYQQGRVQILAFTVAAIVALIGFSLQLKYPTNSRLADIYFMYAYAPYIVLIPSCLLMISISRHISDLGSYISIFHEADNDCYGWEILNFARRRERPWAKIWVSTRASITLSYLLLSGISHEFCNYVSQLPIEKHFGPRCVDLGIFTMSWPEFIKYLNHLFCGIVAILTLVTLLPVMSLKRKRRHLNKWFDLREKFNVLESNPLEWLKNAADRRSATLGNKKEDIDTD